VYCSCMLGPNVRGIWIQCIAAVRWVLAQMESRFHASWLYAGPRCRWRQVSVHRSGTLGPNARGVLLHGTTLAGWIQCTWSLGPRNGSGEAWAQRYAGYAAWHGRTGTGKRACRSSRSCAASSLFSRDMAACTPPRTTGTNPVRTHTLHSPAAEALIACASSAPILHLCILHGHNSPPFWEHSLWPRCLVAHVAGV